jgi:hypothetical protein
MDRTEIILVISVVAVSLLVLCVDVIVMVLK